MRTEIISRNYKANDKLRDIIEKKIAKFDKYFKNDAKAKVVMSEIGHDKYTMEVTIEFDKLFVRSEVTTPNMYDNIDIVLPKIESQIRKSRHKITNKLKTNVEFNEEVLYEVNIAETEDKDKIGKLARVKKFELSIVSPEDAIHEMELLGHNFFVFLNGETGKVAVIYKRDDGDYGMLDPQY